MTRPRVLVSTRNLSHKEWLEWRRKGIGGSDAAAIASLNRYRSPIGVYLEKVGDIPADEAGEAAYWGKVLEDTVAREFTKRTSLRVQRRNAILQHPQYPWMIANIDREIVDPEHGRGVLECKTASEFKADEWEDDKAPDGYIIQVQHYLAVTGYAYAHLAVLIGGNRFKFKLIPRDEEIIRYLVKIEADFWGLVKARTPPEMDGSQASTDVLALLYPTSSGQMDLPSDAEALITDYNAAREAEEAAAYRKETAANKLKALLGPAECGRLGNWLVNWKSISSSRVDTKALKSAHPDIYQQFARESPYRRFGLKSLE